MLLVPTQPLMDERDELPTRQLALTVPALVSLVAEARVSQPPDRRASATSFESIVRPLARSARYMLGDGTTLLLQDLAGEPSAPLLAYVDPLWQSGVVSLNRAQSDATGRYAMFDLSTGAQHGDVVSATGAVQEHRVVCFTPGGQIYLAASRDALLVLDVEEPTWHSTIGDLTVDLHWAACAHD